MVFWRYYYFMHCDSNEFDFALLFYALLQNPSIVLSFIFKNTPHFPHEYTLGSLCWRPDRLKAPRITRFLGRNRTTWPWTFLCSAALKFFNKCQTTASNLYILGPICLSIDKDLQRLLFGACVLHIIRKKLRQRNVQHIRGFLNAAAAQQVYLQMRPRCLWNCASTQWSQSCGGPLRFFRFGAVSVDSCARSCVCLRSDKPINTRITKKTAHRNNRGPASNEY